MRILFLSRFQDTVERGAESFVYELSSRLKKKHEVDIFKGRDADSLTKILAGRYDIVVSLNGGLQGLKASMGRLVGHYKLIVVGEAGIGRVAIWNTAVVQPDVFVAVTDYMANYVKNWAWNSRVVKINNGVDLERFTPTGQKININLPRPIILSVGALVWYKHHERVIEAIKRIGYGSVLIVGEGPEKDSLEQSGKNLGDRFKIARFSYDDMPKVYRGCDIFSLPSWDREAFGIVYLEALASGLGVVAPDDSSRREIVGDAGLFINVENPSDYVQTIDKALKIDWLKKARTQAEKFSWEKIALKYEELMFDMIKK